MSAPESRLAPEAQKNLNDDNVVGAGCTSKPTEQEFISDHVRLIRVSTLNECISPRPQAVVDMAGRGIRQGTEGSNNAPVNSCIDVPLTFSSRASRALNRPVGLIVPRELYLPKPSAAKWLRLNIQAININTIYNIPINRPPSLRRDGLGG
jgi:hypothetical protein